MKFLADFTYRNLHGFVRFSGDSTALVLFNWDHPRQRTVCVVVERRQTSFWRRVLCQKLAEVSFMVSNFINSTLITVKIITKYQHLSVSLIIELTMWNVLLTVVPLRRGRLLMLVLINPPAGAPNSDCGGTRCTSWLLFRWLRPFYSSGTYRCPFGIRLHQCVVLSLPTMDLALCWRRWTPPCRLLPQLLCSWRSAVPWDAKSHSYWPMSKIRLSIP